MAKQPPFRRVLSLNEPVLVGAQWWQDILAPPVDVEGRRRVLRMTIGAGVLVAGAAVGTLLATSPASDSDSQVVQDRDALQMQNEYGWNLGAGNDPLFFESPVTVPGDRDALGRLHADLAPRQPALRPFYVPTLFQSLSAQPTAPPEPGVAPRRSLKDELRPVLTFPMRVAHSQGRAMASLLQGAPPGKAILVDLPGPEAVAFAAGLSERCDPVFLFDNWPHPRGVVPAHQTLAAAWKMQPVFVASAKKRTDPAIPVFVLDRNRLLPYTDSSDRFDNRYVARVPSAEALGKLWIKEILYVAPPLTPQVELDDLNDELIAWRAAGLTVHMVVATDFERPAPPAPVSSAAPTRDDDHGDYYYGGGAAYHWYFWTTYRWGVPPYRVHGIPPRVYPGWNYTVMRRPTIFGSGGLRGRRPAGMGRVYVSASRTTGRPSGVGFRSGSFSRAGGTGG